MPVKQCVSMWPCSRVDQHKQVGFFGAGVNNRLDHEASMERPARSSYDKSRHPSCEPVLHKTRMMGGRQTKST